MLRAMTHLHAASRRGSARARGSRPAAQHGICAPRFVIEVRPVADHVKRCSQCGAPVTRVRETTTRRVRDSATMARDTWLVVPRARVKCPRCGPTVEAVQDGPSLRHHRVPHSTERQGESRRTEGRPPDRGPAARRTAGERGSLDVSQAAGAESVARPLQHKRRADAYSTQFTDTVLLTRESAHPLFSGS